MLPHVERCEGIVEQGEETSVHVLCKSEVLATVRHSYWGCTWTPGMVKICVWEQSGTSLEGTGSTDSESSFGGTKALLKMSKNIEIEEGLNPLFIRGKYLIELFTTGCNQLSHH